MIEWVQKHGVELLALLGALYAVALAIVKLTPTPRDDAALEKVSVVLKALALVFGLNLKQGIEAKPKPPASGESGRVHVGLLLAVIALVLLTGCASAGDQYQASSIAFVAAVDAATELRKAGKLDEAVVREIDLAVDDGHAALHLWAQALKDGQDYPGGVDVVALVVQRIRKHLQAKE